MPVVNGSGETRNASSRDGDWRPITAEMPSPGVSLPGPVVTTPSPDLPVASPWLPTPAGNVAEFEQRVLNRRGPAQVGFGFMVDLLSYLTVYFTEFLPR